MKEYPTEKMQLLREIAKSFLDGQDVDLISFALLADWIGEEFRRSFNKDYRFGWARFDEQGNLLEVDVPDEEFTKFMKLILGVGGEEDDI